MGPTLLYVSYHYPAGGGSGAHRTAKLARYLCDAGWNVIVLCGPAPTVSPSFSAGPFRLLSVEDLFHPVPARRQAGGEVLARPPEPDRPSRLRILLRKMAFMPDPQIYWIPKAFAAARRTLRETPPAAVLCSGPPFSVFLLGWLLKAARKIPLILDYRDVWLDHPWWPVPPWRRGLEAWLERRMLHAADLVLANHDAMRHAFVATTPWISNRTAVVPNGFDPDELGPPCRPSWQPGERFEIVYAGTFYGSVPARDGQSNSLSVQRPVGFLRALRDLSERRAFGPGGVRATFLGAKVWTEEATNLSACARDCGAGDLVQVLPRMDKSEVVPALRGAHLLLNILYHTEAQIAQKIYDYLHLEIPILSLLRDSKANSSIVQRARAGPILDPADVSGITAAIERIVSDYAAGRRPIESDRSFIDQFDVRAQARLLDSLLRKLVERRRGPAGRPDGA